MHRVPLAATAGQPSPSIRSGDTVQITTRDGHRVQFTVGTADTTTITAQDGTKYELADILTVERRGFSGLKTTFLVVGVWGVAAIISYGAASAALLGAQ
jgi:hypothetical protein